MKHLVILLFALALTACNSADPPETQVRPRVEVPDFWLDAFGGRFLGVDKGEWAGTLSFQDPGGSLHVLLEENVHGIVQNSTGIFVFTGLAHLDRNEGYVYRVEAGPGEIPRARLLGRLPGAPSQIQAVSGGATSFLVVANTLSKDGRRVYECYELTGATVTRGTRCRPPGLGSNNSFKANRLRRSA